MEELSKKRLKWYYLLDCNQRDGFEKGEVKQVLCLFTYINPSERRLTSTSPQKLMTESINVKLNHVKSLLAINTSRSPQRARSSFNRFDRTRARLAAMQVSITFHDLASRKNDRASLKERAGRHRLRNRTCSDTKEARWILSLGKSICVSKRWNLFR